MLTGDSYPAEEFSSIYGQLGFGGMFYDPAERPPLHFPYEGRQFDELNTVTQSGKTAMLRKDRWKLIYDARGRGELYDLAADPAELANLFAEPALAGVRADLLAELLRWSIATEDDLPTGVYTVKRAPHNWTRS